MGLHGGHLCSKAESWFPGFPLFHFQGYVLVRSLKLYCSAKVTTDCGNPYQIAHFTIPCAQQWLLFS
jgi:hypothetical protein